MATPLALYGLAVWGVAHLGLLPGIGLFPRTTREPRERVALVVGAHLVWGGVAGWLTRWTAR